MWRCNCGAVDDDDGRQLDGLAVGVGALHADNRLVTSSRMMSLDRAVTQAGKKAIARRGERTHQVGPDANQFVRILLLLRRPRLVGSAGACHY